MVKEGPWDTLSQKVLGMASQRCAKARQVVVAECSWEIIPPRAFPSRGSVHKPYNWGRKLQESSGLPAGPSSE